ncbi:helix-turn-helix transcriptional regulator [Intestinibacter bartlettii]|uniref:AraC family transcriptional regulator n=1 Tax=Intestinibacter bartlettii TaxID=261299 RepID=A0ABS6DYR1_9FIRM|nr:helix-turn-helix domain-containing protein [Intestinibacter bartlettii]MBU5336981.1 AraC family transcriptional regulator [Intestinibacter bartlettii]
MIDIVNSYDEKAKELYQHCDIFYNENIFIAKSIPSDEYMTKSRVHNHNEYEFFIPKSPIPFLVNEDSIFFGEIGYIYTIKSKKNHGIKYGLSDIKYTDILVKKDYLQNIMEELNCKDSIFNYPIYLSRELKFYLHIFEEEFQKYDKKDLIKLDMIANLLCRGLVTGNFNKEIDIFKEKQSYQKGIYLVADFINHNYNREIKIDEMAKIAGLSKNYFGSAFKKALGETPHSYLIKIRISKAKVLLETTDESLSDIAQKVGFKKASSFTSQFKASTGIIPSKYREKSKKQY